MPGQESASQENIKYSRYFEEQTDGTYVANATLENIAALMQERVQCNYYGQNVVVNLNATIGNHNLPIVLEESENAYGLSVEKIGNNYPFNLGAMNLSFQTFQDEYLVIVATHGTSGSDIQSIHIYDVNGNNILTVDNITGNITENKLTYTKNCYSFEEVEMATFGEIKYDTKNKQFIHNVELKNASTYCK